MVMYICLDFSPASRVPPPPDAPSPASGQGLEAGPVVITHNKSRNNNSFKTCCITCIYGFISYNVERSKTGTTVYVFTNQIPTFIEYYFQHNENGEKTARKYAKDDAHGIEYNFFICAHIAIS